MSKEELINYIKDLQLSCREIKREIENFKRELKMEKREFKQKMRTYMYNQIKLIKQENGEI